MSSKEFELVMINFILLLAAITLLLFIMRVIKILTGKKLEKGDESTMLFILVFMCIIGYCAYKIKQAFKKEDKHPVV